MASPRRKSYERLSKARRGPPAELGTRPGHLARLVAVLQKVSEAAGSLFKTLMSLVGIGIVGTLLFWIVREALRPTLVVDTFAVSSSLADIGIPGEVVSKALVDRLHRVAEKADTPLKRLRFLAEGQAKVPEARLEGTGVSIGQVLELLRELWGGGERLQGELVLDGDLMVLRARLTGSNRAWAHEAELGGGNTKVDVVGDLLERLAVDVYLEHDPLVAAAYLYAVDHRRCLAAVRRCLRNERDDDDAAAQNIWAQLLADAGRVEEAIERLEESRRRHPGYARTYYNLARIQQLQKKSDQEKSDSGIQSLGSGLGAIAAEAGPEASAEIRKELAPLNSYLGYLLCRRKECGHGLKHHEQAIGGDPGSGLNRFRYALALREVGQEAECDRALAEAELYGAHDAEMHLTWGRMLFAQRRFSEAQPHFERALEIEPGLLESNVYAGNTYLRLYQQTCLRTYLRRALSVFQAAEAVNPDSAHTAKLIGVAHLEAGELKRAAAAFEQCVVLDPAHGCQCSLRGVLISLGDQVAAERMETACRQLNGSGGVVDGALQPACSPSAKL